MARRKKSSPVKDLIALIALLPWWAGVVLAVVLYLVLHRLASQPVATAVQPGQVVSIVNQSIWRPLASFGQYILPIICLAGAGMSAWKRRERRTLVANVVKSGAADALDGMSWQEFERVVGEAFRLQGYSVAETGGGGADGGVDLVLTRNREKFLVQCKQWRAFKVGVDVVRELYGVMAAKGAAGGFVVTSGRFTEEAAAFASGRNVNLVDGPQLHALIRQARGEGVPGEPWLDSIHSSSASAAPVAPPCPVCSKTMVKRQARQGARAGKEFWGCAAYPACRGTCSIDA